MPRSSPKATPPRGSPAAGAKENAKPEAHPWPAIPLPGLQMGTLGRIPIARAPMPMARRFMQIASAIWAEACAGDSLTHLEFGTLGSLQREPNLDQISLAERIGVDRTNIGLIIDELEKKGFVERTVNPNDRRARLIQVTPDGVAAFARQAPRTAIVREKIFAPLTAAERETFYDLLERIIAANEQYVIPGAGRRKRGG